MKARPIEHDRQKVEVSLDSRGIRLDAGILGQCATRLMWYVSESNVFGGATTAITAIVSAQAVDATEGLDVGSANMDSARSGGDVRVAICEPNHAREDHTIPSPPRRKQGRSPASRAQRSLHAAAIVGDTVVLPGTPRPLLAGATIVIKTKADSASHPIFCAESAGRHLECGLPAVGGSVYLRMMSRRRPGADRMTPRQ